MAMGGSSVALLDGVLSMFANPALLSDTRGTEIAASFGILRLSEQIISPDGNDSYNSQGLVQPLSVAVACSPGGGLRVAFGSALRYDFNYENKNPSYFSTDENTWLKNEGIESVGGLRSFSLSISHRFFHNSSLGIAYNYHQGKRNFIHRFSSHEERWEDNGLSGSNLLVGLSWVIVNRLVLASTWETGMTVMGDHLRYEYPPAYSLGLGYQFGDGPNSNFTVQLTYEDWSAAGASYIDKFEVHAGVEHRYRGGIPFRYGLAIIPWYADRRYETILLTAGTGFRLGGLSFDIGAEWGKRDFMGVAPVFAADRRINETTIRILITGKYGWLE